MKRKISRARVVRAIKIVEQFLNDSLTEPRQVLSRHKGTHRCSRADFIRVAASFDRPFTQEEMATALRQQKLRYQAKTPIDAIRTRLNKDPMFKTHKTNSTIPKAHFMLDRKIARLVAAEV